MPGPARKRQKTAHKVAELEKKINALTQSLLAKSQPGPTPQPSPIVADGNQSAKESFKDSPEERANFALFPKSATPAPLLPQVKTDDADYEDVIDRGIVSFAVADRIFDKFNNELNPQFPLIAFPPGTTAASVRRSRPMLFLAILTAGCITVVPEIHAELMEESARQFSHRVFFLFARSVDLVQALLVTTTWAGKHKLAKDIGFNQYIHSAIVMAHDLGLSKRLKTPLTKDPVEQAELRRTWVACYWCGMCVSTILRHPAMIHSTPYLQECLAFLEESPAAQPLDKTLCCLVKAAAIMEDVARSFHMTDPASVIRVEDSSTQYALKVFEQRIDDWEKASKAYMTPGLHSLTGATISLYAHEIALHTDHNIDDFRPPTNRPGEAEDQRATNDFVTPLHCESISKCVVAMKQIFDTFTNMFSPSAFRQLPCLSMVWTAYCAVAMIRLDGALRATESKYADIFLPDLNVDVYLDSIVSKLSIVASQSPASAPPTLFHQAFQKLKLWHQYRISGTLPADYERSMDVEHGMYTVKNSVDKFAEEQGFPNNPQALDKTEIPSRGLGVGTTGLGAASNQFRHRQQGVNNAYMPISNAQTGFDTQGGSWLTNSNLPIDASMFENQDWNFSLADWNNFEASMVQPAEDSLLNSRIQSYCAPPR
ncbi:hypothetical protein LTS08_000232 [Lithohypha guttulata]|nr:hypothetical protein LTS08_000232 [Lithohypha guttulata]